MKRISEILLIAGGIANLATSLLHIIMIFVGVSAYQYFGAPTYFIQHSDTIYTFVLMLLLALLFFLAGLYALSGAGLMRRLPGTRNIILIVGFIFTVRGAVVFLKPFPKLVNQLIMSYPNVLGMDRPLMTQDWFFSLAWLLVGLAYLTGWMFSSTR